MKTFQGIVPYIDSIDVEDVVCGYKKRRRYPVFIDSTGYFQKTIDEDFGREIF
jgi:hypothetical protein